MNKSFKILHCANFNEIKNGATFYSQDRKISHGLIRNGHMVYDFSYRTVAKNSTIFKSKKLGSKNMNELLIKTAENLKPDLLLLGHSEIVFDTTLEILKSKYPNMKIAMWWVDPFTRSEHIDSRLKYLDAFFATTDPFYFKDLFKNKAIFAYMPNICDKSFEYSKSFENKNYSYDLIYTGRIDDNRKDMIKKLQTLDDKINFKLFGSSNNDLVLGSDYAELIYNSRMAINYSRFNNISLYSSDRIVQMMANGILIFTPKVPNFEILFSDDEVVYFDNFNDLEKKVNYYLQNDDERIKIAKKGWKKVHQSYNSTRVTKFMIETIFDLDYTEEYEWKNQIIRNRI
jgi:glycosyltransferase involved in cell wall biosynthesis